MAVLVHRRDALEASRVHRASKLSFCGDQKLVLWGPNFWFCGDLNLVLWGPKFWFCGDLNLVCGDLNFGFVGT